MRIAFAGTPDFARVILARLLAAAIRPVLVLTQPDRPSGRGRRTLPSAVKAFASEHSLSVFQPARLRAAADVQMLIDAAPDVLIVAAYGLILPRRVLDVPRLGCLNVHASLLPRWRGAAPVERAILAGDRATGVSLMLMDAGLDTGPVFDRAATAIRDDETGLQLEARLAELGATRLLALLPDVVEGRLRAVPQDELGAPVASPWLAEFGATYAPKLTRADAQLDWSQSAEVMSRRIRALAGRISVEVQIGDARLQLLRARSGPQVDSPAQVQVGTILTVRPTIEVQCVDGVLQITQLRFVDRGKGTILSAVEAANGFSQILHPGAQVNVSR